MIISFLICGIACWLIEFALRKFGHAAAVYRPRLVAMFGAALFLNVIFAVGFLCQPFVDAYVGGTLTQFIYDLQATPFEYISSTLGNTYILATIPTIPALVAFYLCRNFLVSVACAATAAVFSFLIRFVVAYWSSRYSGSLGLSGLILVVGCALSCYLALALAYEGERILRMFHSSNRRPAITMLTMAGFTSVLSILIPASLYYVFVFPLARQVDAKLAGGNYIMLSGSTERPVHSQVLGDAFPFQPALPFQRAYLEEAAQLDLATQAPKARARVQLHIANVIRPSYTIATSTGFRWVKGEGPSSYGGFNLTVLRFDSCTMRNITNLRHKLAEGKIGYNYDVGRAALLEYRAYQSWIFPDSSRDSDLAVMLPAWNDDNIHLMIANGGASVGAQEPLRGSGRAMLTSASRMGIVVVTSPDFTEDDVIQVVNREGTPITRLPHAEPAICAKHSDRTAGSVIPLDAIENDNRAALGGYLVEVSAHPLVDRVPNALTLRITNPDQPTSLRENLSFSTLEDQPVSSLLPGAVGTSLTISDLPGGKYVGTEGHFGGSDIPKGEYKVVHFGGDRIFIEDDRAHAGVTRVKGQASIVSLDDDRYFDTIASQTIGAVGLAFPAALLSAVLGLVVIVWKRKPTYQAQKWVEPPLAG